MKASENWYIFAPQTSSILFQWKKFNKSCKNYTQNNIKVWNSGSDIASDISLFFAWNNKIKREKVLRKSFGRKKVPLNILIKIDINFHSKTDAVDSVEHVFNLFIRKIYKWYFSFWARLLIKDHNNMYHKQ